MALSFVLPSGQPASAPLWIVTSSEKLVAPSVREKVQEPSFVSVAVTLKATSPPSSAAALPCVNHGHNVAARAPLAQSARKAIRSRVRPGIVAVIVGLLSLAVGRLKHVGFQNLSALLDHIETVDLEVFELVDLAAEPTNLHQVYLLRLVETEVQAQIVL
jgi:hypothetical protein